MKVSNYIGWDIGGAHLKVASVDASGKVKLVEQFATKLEAVYDPKSVGLFVWAKLSSGAVDAETFIDKILQEQHIFITPGTIFGSQGEGYIRFSLCVPEATIEEAIKRISS